MRTALAEAWDKLAGEPIQPSQGYRLRLLSARSLVRCFAALCNPAGEPGLLIEVPTGAPKHRFSDYSTRAFTVEFGRPEGIASGCAAIVITLREQSCADLFLLMAASVAEAASAALEPVAALAAVGGVLERWRAFMQRRSALLSAEEVRGLIGELVTLARLSQIVGERAAVEAWKGPIGGIRDFETDSLLVETKTFSPSAGATVYISDPLQLEGTQATNVLLTCVPLEKTDGGSTLDQFLSAVNAHLADPGARDLLAQRVAAAGFLPEMSEVLKERFIAHEPRVFRVTDTFPRIHPGQVPLGIRHVRFAIELSALGAFAEDTSIAIGPRAAARGGVILS